MIFSPVLTVPCPFTQAELDAINIFARFSSLSLRDINHGVGGNIEEFEIDLNLLAISIQLYYSEASELDVEKLKTKLSEFKAGIKEHDLTPEDAEIICGSRLLYLVLAARGDEIMESISEDQYQVYREVLIKLQNLIKR